MVTTLQNTYLSWDLGAQVEYQAGQELQFILHFSAPEAKKFYLLGALYTKDLAYIPGTIFGIFQPPGTDYGTGSTEYVTVWELEPEESVDLPCRLTLNRSDVVLGLFLFRMEGDTPSLDVDEDIAVVSVELVSPTLPWTGESIITTALMLGMMGFVAYEGLKD